MGSHFTLHRCSVKWPQKRRKGARQITAPHQPYTPIHPSTQTSILRPSLSADNHLLYEHSEYRRRHSSCPVSMRMNSDIHFARYFLSPPNGHTPESKTKKTGQAHHLPTPATLTTPTTPSRPSKQTSAHPVSPSSMRPPYCFHALVLERLDHL